MFTLHIKAAASDINVPAARSLLLLAAMIVWLSRNENIFAVNMIVLAAIIIADLFTATLLVKYRINSLLLLGIAAILVAAATRDLMFPLLLIIIAFVINASYVKPVVEVQEKGIWIKKSFSSKTFGWQNFSNVVLKDNLLTIDFTNNKILQLELDNSVTVNEQQFNDYCAQKITQ
jgi:hypothetical protein